jgi:hypothetical protein
MSIQCIDTLPDYMGEGGFEYSDVANTRKIHTAVRSRLHSSQKQATTKSISQKKHQLCKIM